MTSYVKTDDAETTLFSAIHDLIQGRLSQDLITPEQLQTVLDAVNRNLTSTYGSRYRLI